MSGSFNRVELTGNLGADPEILRTHTPDRPATTRPTSFANELDDDIPF